MFKKLLSLLIVCILTFSSAFTLFADATTYKVGDIIELGNFPQSLVSDEELISQLNALDVVWYSFDNYYFGTCNYGTMVESDYMRYANVEYEGERYKGIYFIKYRPSYTYNSPLSEYSYQDDNGYYTGQTYWFKYEPIEWIVLDPINGLMISKLVIDGQPFSNTMYQIYNNGADYSLYADADGKYYCNQYSTSSVRNWLSDYFLEEAFCESERQQLIPININDDLTEEKVWLPSYEDVNDSYGFNDKASRIAQATEYAFCNGLPKQYNNNATYLLRTSGWRQELISCVTSSGELNDGYNSAYINGIRPMIKCSAIMSNSSHVHSYKETTVEPTCSEKGFTEYYCFGCGDKIIGDYTNALGHDYSTEIVTQSATCTENGSKLLICSRCNDRHTEEIEVTGHSPVIEIVKEPSCTEPGVQYEKCSVCGERLGENTEYESISALGHSYKATYEWSENFSKCKATAICENNPEHTFSEEATISSDVKVKPTCTKSGITTYLASFNNKFFCRQQKDIEDIPPTGHTVTVAPAKEATCDNNGLTEGSYCSACGKRIVEQRVTPKLNHIDSDNNGYCDLCSRIMTGGEHCPQCGQIHTGFFGGIIKFLHQVLYMFSR